MAEGDGDEAKEQFLRPPPFVAQLVKNLPAMRETWVQSLLGTSPGEGNSYPLQHSGLENSMDCIVHEITKSWTQLNNCFLHSSVPQFERININKKTKRLRKLNFDH